MNIEVNNIKFHYEVIGIEDVVAKVKKIGICVTDNYIKFRGECKLISNI